MACRHPAQPFHSNECTALQRVILRTAMKSPREGFRDPTFPQALEAALSGKTDALYTLLAKLSGLPGTRVNLGMVEAFATEVAAIGKRGDALLRAMILLDADFAPGGSAHEIVPVCAVYALGLRGRDPSARAMAIDLLHAASDDLRFRVRDAVPIGIARIGEVVGDPLVREIAPYMDGYFHAAAALGALGIAGFLDATKDAAEVTARLHEGFMLVKDANRSASRYPGHKALMDALLVVPPKLARRYPSEIVAEVDVWATVKDPALRTLAHGVAKGLRARYGEEAERIAASLQRTKPIPRDPTLFVHGTRGRGRKKGLKGTGPTS